MNTTPQQNSGSSIWSRILIIVGSIAMLGGALDPMEGSLVILSGSGLVALGTFFNQGERGFFAYRLLVFILIAIGVGAMWGLTSVGGFGGSSGRTIWWGALILPYLIGWSMGMWGPGSPRWLLLLGILVSLFYLAIFAIIMTHAGRQHQAAGAIILGTLGLVTIVGCSLRLARRIPVRT
jgi:hypothetical protein